MCDCGYPSGIKRRVALILRQILCLSEVMRGLFRLVQPRFSVGVVGVILNEEGHVLLVEHVFHPADPWGLPGGWLKCGEQPADGLRREVMEETGLEIVILEPLLAEIRFRQHLDIAFMCRARGDVELLSDELLDYRWVELEAVPRLVKSHLASSSIERAWQRISEEQS